MKYYSVELNKLFDSVEELEAAEKKAHDEKREKEELAKAEAEKKAQLKAQREDRAKEVQAAFQEARTAQEKANKILADFCKDYGAYHFSARGNDVFPLHNSLVDFILDRF